MASADVAPIALQTSLARTADVGRIAIGDLLSADVDGRPLGYGAVGTERFKARWALWPRERPGRPYGRTRR